MNVSRKSTTSAFRSGCVSLTQGSPRRAVARPPLVPAEPHDLRVRGLRLEARREVEQELEPPDRMQRAQLELDRDGLALELALAVDAEDRADPRRAGVGEAQDEHRRERGR